MPCLLLILQTVKNALKFGKKFVTYHCYRPNVPHYPNSYVETKSLVWRYLQVGLLGSD